MNQSDLIKKQCRGLKTSSDFVTNIRDLNQNLYDDDPIIKTVILVEEDWNDRESVAIYDVTCHDQSQLRLAIYKSNSETDVAALEPGDRLIDYAKNWDSEAVKDSQLLCEILEIEDEKNYDPAWENCPESEKITFRNPFHHTEVSVCVPANNILSRDLYNWIADKLCGMDDCTCLSSNASNDPERNFEIEEINSDELKVIKK